MVYLVDTSVWIEYFRSQPTVDLATLADFDDDSTGEARA